MHFTGNLEGLTWDDQEKNLRFGCKWTWHEFIRHWFKLILHFLSNILQYKGKEDYYLRVMQFLSHRGKKLETTQKKLKGNQSVWPTEPFTVRKKFTILSSQSTGCRTTRVRNRFKALFLASMNSLLPEMLTQPKNSKVTKMSLKLDRSSNYCSWVDWQRQQRFTKEL